MNLNQIVTTAITAVTPFVPVQIYTYAGSAFSMGDDTPTYNAPISAMANMQLYNKQDLIHVDGYNKTSIYKRFFINANLTGLNRNLNTGGDYLTWTNPNTNTTLKYKIVMVKNDFNVGYTEVIGVESVVTE